MSWKRPWKPPPMTVPPIYKFTEFGPNGSTLYCHRAPGKYGFVVGIGVLEDETLEGEIQVFLPDEFAMRFAGWIMGAALAIAQNESDAERGPRRPGTRRSRPRSSVRDS